MSTQWTRCGVSWFSGVAVLFLAALPAHAEVKVCVEVVLQEADAATSFVPAGPAEAAQPGFPAAPDVAPPAPVDDGAAMRQARLEALRELARMDPVLPIGQTPVRYLKRLIEHFVTHERGFVTVAEGCDQVLTVELYPLVEGWTVFARYSGNGREERVDKLTSKELSAFAERAALALLHDVPISGTISRDNVLESDSKKSAQRIRGTHHFIMDVGTQLRFWQFSTAVTERGQRNYGAAEDRWRVFTPMTIALGYRGKFEAWGVQALSQVGIGTSKTAPRKNPLGGHVDFGGDAGLQLHFLRYLDPRGLSSFYFGAGTTFELLWFSVIRPETEYGDDRSTLLSGGVDVDVVCGWEFMRASSVQFYLQAGLHLPAYALQSGNNDGRVNGWFPGASVKLGVMF